MDASAPRGVDRFGRMLAQGCIKPAHCQPICAYGLAQGTTPMLTKLTVQNFKSLRDVAVEFPKLAVLFGPNAAGKSNLLEAILALSWLGTSRTFAEALDNPWPVRGFAFEAVSWPTAGLPALLQQEKGRFCLEADLDMPAGRCRYRIAPEIEFKTGRIGLADECLVRLNARGVPKHKPMVEVAKDKLCIRKTGQPGRPRQEPLGLNHSILSDSSFGGAAYPWFDYVRNELWSWRVHFLEPRFAMRSERAPADVRDIGVQGENIAPFLYGLKHNEPAHFEAVTRTLRALVPNIEDLHLALDEQRGMLYLSIRQGGVDYSSRLLSEGTMRALALSALAANPRHGALIAFEEPENGVDPRQLDWVARLFLALSRRCQVIVTTHSPLFCSCILKHSKSQPADMALLHVQGDGHSTTVRPLDTTGPLFTNSDLIEALGSGGEDILFEGLLLRGLLDE